ncbi:MAG TPA: DUF6502 family protein [Nitrospiria bacterium]|jgi:hypothetical protein|nr:DUF6502 family protein [Nitrospiria bacterium]
MSEIKKALYTAALNILRPLIRILLRNHIPFGAFADLAKRVYVDVALEEFGIPGRKPSISRVSIITGLTRKEVSLIKKPPSLENGEELERYNRGARVISGWIRDRAFWNKEGQPSELPIEGKETSFNELVRRYGGDVPSRAVLDELLRVGAVERLPDGRVRLIARAFIPHAQEADKIRILGTDVRDLISTIDHNLQSHPSDSFLQRKVSYDNLPAEALSEIRIQAVQKGQSLLEELDRLMSQKDRDINPSSKGTGRKRATIGIFYFEDDAQPPDKEKKNEGV